MLGWVLEELCVNGILFDRNSVGFRILYSFQVTIGKTWKRFLIENPTLIALQLAITMPLLLLLFYFIKWNRSIHYQSWLCSFSGESKNTGLTKKKSIKLPLVSSFQSFCEMSFNNCLILWNQGGQEWLSLSWQRKMHLLSIALP